MKSILDRSFNGIVLSIQISLLSLVSPIAIADEIVKCPSRAGQLVYTNVPCENLNGLPGKIAGQSSVQPEAIKRPRIDSDQTTAVQEAPNARTMRIDGAYHLNGYIGNKPVRFLVDTGAMEVSIPYTKAVELGIPLLVGERAVAITAGNQVQIYKIRLESITIGSVTVRNVAAHVAMNPGGSQEVLLGMSFLRHVSVVMRDGALTISR